MKIRWSLQSFPWNEAVLSLLFALITSSCIDNPPKSEYSYPICSRHFLLVEMDAATMFKLWDSKETSGKDVHAGNLGNELEKEEWYFKDTDVLMLNFSERKGDRYKICSNSELFGNRWLVIEGNYLALNANQLFENCEITKYTSIYSRPDENSNVVNSGNLNCVRSRRMIENWILVEASKYPCDPNLADFPERSEEPYGRFGYRGFVKWREGDRMLVKLRW